MALLLCDLLTLLSLNVIGVRDLLLGRVADTDLILAILAGFPLKVVELGAEKSFIFVHCL